MEKGKFILSIEKITKRFGGFFALQNVNINVKAGERRAIIGPNGAGKSTLFNVIDGHLKPTSGRIFMDSEDLTELPLNKRWNLGITRTFQRNNLFLGLTAEQNVRLALQARYGLGKHIFSAPGKFHHLNQETQQVLDNVKLSDYGETLARDMDCGQQRKLEVAIALAGGPKILLLDEPTAGMSPAETQEMIAMLKGILREITLLIIEHDMDVIYSLADLVTVLHLGSVIAEGTLKQIEEDRSVNEVYLGRNLDGQ